MLKVVSTANAPKAVGPYSQAVIAGSFLFVSGQLPINPLSQTIEKEDIEWQTAQVLQNLEAILIAAGLNFSHVVKCEIFLKNISDFKSVNALYEKAFSYEIKPARQTIEVAALPMGAKIEISCIAFRQ